MAPSRWQVRRILARQTSRWATSAGARLRRLSATGTGSRTGAGTLRLTGPLNGTGAIAAAAGTLQVEPSTAFNSFAVANSAVLAINSGAGSFALTAPSVSLVSGSTVQFDLDTNAVTTVPLMVINNPDGLMFSGNPTLKLTNLQA